MANKNKYTLAHILIVITSCNHTKSVRVLRFE